MPRPDGTSHCSSTQPRHKPMTHRRRDQVPAFPAPHEYLMAPPTRYFTGSDRPVFMAANPRMQTPLDRVKYVPKLGESADAPALYRQAHGPAQRRACLHGLDQPGRRRGHHVRPEGGPKTGLTCRQLGVVAGPDPGCRPARAEPSTWRPRPRSWSPSSPAGSRGPGGSERCRAGSSERWTQLGTASEDDSRVHSGARWAPGAAKLTFFP
jgi:hypothetical protein